MQTFKPTFDFFSFPNYIDSKRLNKQVTEGTQIYNLITKNQQSNPFWKYAAVQMWRGYADTLLKYRDYCYYIWTEERKGNYNLQPTYTFDSLVNDEIDFPNWFFLEEIVLSHRSNLKRKAQNHLQKAKLLSKQGKHKQAKNQYQICEFYQQFDWSDIPNDMPYFYPTHYEEFRQEYHYRPKTYQKKYVAGVQKYYNHYTFIGA